MEVQQELHMNTGEGEFSYYKNSSLQKQVIQMSKPILEEAVAELCRENLPEYCFKMVDMGCSSGPNTLLPLWEIIETIESTCRRLNRNPPALQFFLNDLPGNDFNTVFRSLLPNFYEQLGKEKSDKFGHCFVAAMPGDFHGRLFPDNSLHFVHSSYSLHYLSQVPEGLVSESGEALNKGNICLAKTSPPSVHKAYLDQFERDFTSFLKSRALEMKSGGRMVLTFLGSDEKNPNCEYGSEVWQLIGDCLKDMVDEGKVQESMFDSHNFPVFCPSAKLVHQLIQREGSFNIAAFEELEIDWDSNIEDGNKNLVFDKWTRGKYVSNYVRAIAEAMLTSQFESALMDDIFHRFSLKVLDYLDEGRGIYHNLVISMVKM